MIGIASFAISMSQSLLLTFSDEILALTETEYIIVAALMVVVLVGSIMFWKNLVGKVGKKPTLLYIFLVAIAVLPFSLLGFIPLDNYLGVALAFIPAVAIFIGGWNLFPYLIYADLAEEGEKRGDGEMKAGLYAGFPAILLNVFQAVGLLISGAILELPEFAFAAGAYSLGKVLWGPICALVLVGAYFFTRKFVRLDFAWEDGTAPPAAPNPPASEGSGGSTDSEAPRDESTTGAPEASARPDVSDTV